jgi:tetratricopeptide (TPR) repeat protein
VNPDGTFQIRAITAGTYDLRVIGFGNQLLHEETISVNASSQDFTIRLPERSGSGSANRAAGTSVSYAQLQHKIPAQAQKLFDKGEQALAKHNLPQACDYYRQAVASDPGFADAYAQLGSTEASLGRLPDAAADFQKAIDVAPEHQLALSNLAIVLAKLRRFHEAGEVARRALKVVPGSGRVHYILAASLIEEKGNIDEAIEHLELAGGDIPSAHLAASDLLIERGRHDEAVRQIEAYLLVADPHDALRAKAEARLSQLQQH